MAQRRLVLNRESLVPLDTDELERLAVGAATPLCVLTNPRYTCQTCGVACTTQCDTWDCS